MKRCVKRGLEPDADVSYAERKRDELAQKQKKKSGVYTHCLCKECDMGFELVPLFLQLNEVEVR